jgi:Zn finger protein HypA/HybF involved in hydrogenase expression
MRIIRNSVRCLKCGEEIESTNRHDFVTCKCGNVSVDGGKDYLRRVFKSRDYEDTSTTQEEV